MSVWKSACFKDDCFQFFSRNCPPNLASFTKLRPFLDFETELDGPLNEYITLKPGNVSKQIDDRQIVHFASHPGVTKSEALIKTIDGVPNFRFGLHAVYTFIAHIWPRIYDHGYGEPNDGELEKDIFVIGLIGGAHSQNDIMHKAPIMNQAYKNYVAPVQFINKAMRHAAAAAKQRRYYQDMKFADAAGLPLPELKTDLNKFFPLHKIYSHRQALMIIDKTGKFSLVLLQKDLDRIEKFIMGAAQSRVYAELYGVLNKSQRYTFTTAIKNWQDQAVEVMRSVNKEDCGLVCRTFDVAYFVTLADFGKDIDDEPLRLQLKKYNTECLHKDVPLQQILQHGIGLPFKEKLECYQQYKLFPQPDFDSYSAMARQEAMYQKYSALYDDVENSEHFEGIMLYHRWMMAVAYHKRHGRCPGHVKDGVEEKKWHAAYPLIDIHHVPFVEIMDVDFAGDFVYNHREDDCLDLIKDKAICPKEIKYIQNAGDLSRLPVSSKSQLVDLLKRSELPNIAALRQSDIMWDVKADDKAESKKKNGRWFFEAGSDARLLISEYEDSNAGYAKNMPGSVLGRSTVDTLKIINAASAYASDAHLTVPIYISFDLEKFSPAFNIRVSQALDKMWAEAYGVPEIAEISKILTEGEIHYVKGNFHHTCKKYGSDFEGFFGRRNTMYHCAVMGYTINRMRAAGLLDREAHFASLIDDGLLRVFVPKAEAKVRVKQIKEFIEKVYKSGSLTISWDKTFVSSFLCVFLNDVKIYGRTITPGLKAILRITNRSEDITPSLLSDLGLVASTTRGALTSGAIPTGAYAIYSLQCGDAIRRWAKNKLKTTSVHVLRFFLPARVGGLGLVGLLSLAGSLVHDDFIESLGVLCAVGTRFPVLQQAIDSIVRISITQQEELARYSNPAKLRSEGLTIKADRGYQKIKHYLMYNAHLPAIDHLQEFIKGGYSDKDSVIPAAPGKLAIEIRERIWNSSPYHVIEGVAAKFMKSTSALVFVPRRVLYRAMIANKTEAVAYFKKNEYVQVD